MEAAKASVKTNVRDAFQRITEGAALTDAQLGAPRNVSVGEGIMLSSLVGVKRAAEILQAMDSFTYVGSDRAYRTKFANAVAGALKGPGKRPGDYTPESIEEAYLKSPLFDATLPVKKPRRHKGFDCKLVHSEVTKVSYMSILCFQHQKRRRRRRRHPAARTRLRTAVKTPRRRTPCLPKLCRW